jgi:hypothetical protein
LVISTVCCALPQARSRSMIISICLDFFVPTPLPCRNLWRRWARHRRGNSKIPGPMAFF